MAAAVRAGLFMGQGLNYIIILAFDMQRIHCIMSVFMIP